MNTISDRADINRLLMQVRDMQSQLKDAAIDPARPDVALRNIDGLPPISESQSSSFGQMLKQAVNSVNETQMKAGELQRAYELSEGNVNLTQVMIQMQKASVSFEAMTQVRNKLVNAYQDIMNMPI